MNKYTRILVLVVTCLAVGYFSSLVTRPSVETWYTTIEKPSFNPPNWLFAPVWTTLYVMMGIAGGLVWHEIDSPRKEEVKKAMLFLQYN